ncbi:hypothetical protein WJ542_21155 [Paraburkholderia sp. B3]|uniref:hypothetical protein n=1 Tax=Paraburkholderia sp. B3 TaxID=3134791 RepID=UPI003982BEE8
MLDLLLQSASASHVELALVNEYGANALMLRIGKSRGLLDPADVDSLIEALGHARIALTPTVPTEVPLDQQFPLETQPLWQTIVDPAFAGVVVFLRHSGFGWTGFAISLASVDRLLEIGYRRAIPPVSKTLN